MAELQLIKVQNGFKPANEADSEQIKKIKIGSLVHADIKQPRNPAFHRKFFTMLNFGFELWEPDLDEVMKGAYASIIPAGWTCVKEFERFRKDMLILAGYREMTVNIKNEVRFEAKSISFAKMEETEFHKVYSAVFNVMWERVKVFTNNMTAEQAENTINEMLSFD